MSTTTKRKASLEDAFEAIGLSEESRRKGEESLRKLSENLKKTNGDFSSNWGKFVESLVEGGLVELLKDRGISADKTILRIDDTKYFLKKLAIFKEIFPEYSSKQVYGAVGYLRYDAHAAIYSEKQGLFVIKATGDSASITNKNDFKPKAF